jgi:UDP-N-acetylglucosamine acyltransferase
MSSGGGRDIHPLALVDARAELGEGVRVGPFAVVEAGAVIGDRCQIEAHAVVRGGAELGPENIVGSFAVLGGAAQDRRYAGEPTKLHIGEKNCFREHFTAHRGTAHGEGVTRVGSGGLFMVGSHVAHDVEVGDGVTLANGTLLAGHVKVGDFVVTGGHVAIAPYVRVGERAFLAGGAMVEHDVPPFVIAAGDRARVRALNKVGLARSDVPEASRAALERAFRAIFRSGSPRAEAARSFFDDADPYVRKLARFVVASRA